MSLKADILRAHLNLFALESRQAREQLQQMMTGILDEFSTMEPEFQEVIIDSLDELAQECVRKRELFDTTILAMKKVQEEAHGG